MKKLRVLDLFSGIGGFSLGLERTGGFETVAFCEIEDFPRKVLRKHWPEVPCYEDVRTLTADTLARDGIAVDVITGGFPCQDLSVAGKRVAECGYDAEWENIPASALGAPHRRERVWLVGYPKQDADGEFGGGTRAMERDCLVSSEWDEKADKPFGPGENVPNADCINAQGQQSCGSHPQIWQESRQRQAVSCHASARGQWRTEPAVGRVANGVPNRVDRLAGLGNAVVPQIPEMIGRAILEAER